MYKTKNQEIVKKFWKYIAIAAFTVVMAPLTACDDDSELGPKDKANYETNFAYCFESDNNYPTLSYRYSGKIIETDQEVLPLVPVRLTKPAPANTTVQIAIDNTLVEEYNAANGTNYEALNGVTIDNPSIKIATGQYMSTDSIKINFNGYSGLAQNGKDLLLPVVIETANNDITISKKSHVYVTFTYSANVVKINNVLYQAGTDKSVWAEKMANLELAAISSIFNADANTTVKCEIDNSLVDVYNEANDCDFLAWEDINIVDAVIAPGENTASIRFNVTDYSQLEKGYVVPVRIVSVEGDGAIVDENATVAYLVVCSSYPVITKGNPIGNEITDRSNWVVKVNGSNQRSTLCDGSVYTDYYLSQGSVIELNIGEVKTLTTVSVQYYGEYWYYAVREYLSIRTSEDGENWTNWQKLPDYYGDGRTNINFSYPVKAQYVELVIGRPGYNSSYGTWAAEIRAYEE